MYLYKDKFHHIFTIFIKFAGYPDH